MGAVGEGAVLPQDKGALRAACEDARLAQDVTRVPAPLRAAARHALQEELARWPPWVERPGRWRGLHAHDRAAITSGTSELEVRGHSEGVAQPAIARKRARLRRGLRETHQGELGRRPLPLRRHREIAGDHSYGGRTGARARHFHPRGLNPL